MSVVLIVSTIVWLQIQLIYFIHQKSQPKSTLLRGFGWLFICDIPISFFPKGSVSSRVSGSCLLQLTTLPVFLTLHVRKKIGLPRWFCSWPITSGNCQCAFRTLQWHFPFFLTLHVRKKIGLPRTFSSWPITSGNLQPSFPAFWGTSRYLFAASSLCFALPVFLICHIRSKNGLPRTFSSRRITLGNPQPAMQCPLWSIPVFLTCNVRTKNAIPRWFCSWRITSGRIRWNKDR